MKRRELVVAGVTSAALSLGSAQQAGNRPNVLLFVADDLGYAGVSYLGGPIPTPHMDALAAKGTRLDPFYVHSNCSSSRAALLTGRHPVRHGLLYGELRPWSPYGLPPTATTIGDWFQAAGYQTAYVGKWQLGCAHRRLHPLSRGFGHFYGHLTQQVHYFLHTNIGGVDWQRNGKTVDEEGYTTDLFAAEATRWLAEREASKPFLLVVSFGALGAPLLANDEAIYQFRQIKNDKQRLYAAATHQLDKAIGDVMTALRQQGLEQNTMVGLVSDNAGLLHAGANHAPYLGGKGSMFEGGLRVPAVLQLPGGMPPLRKGPWHATDIAPTLAAACKVGLPTNAMLDGIGGWEEAQKDRELFFGYKAAESNAFRYALRSGDWKWIFSDGQEYLFHLGRDPKETKDLAGQETGRVESFREKAEAWKQLHPAGDIASSSRPHPGWIAPKDYARAMREE